MTVVPFFSKSRTPGLGQFRQALATTLETIIFNNTFYKL